MKKILCVFLFLLMFTGCKQDEMKIIETTIKENKKESMKVYQGKVATGYKKIPVTGNNRLIVIDPGHQRYGNSAKEPNGPGSSQMKAKVTSGATGVNSGKLESVINLEVSLKLKARLEAAGYQVIMTRTSQDVNISNSERAKIANDNNAAVFIRIHCNSDNASSVNGALTIAPSSSNPYCSQIASSSQALSKSVLKHLCNETTARNRGVMISDTMSGINWCQVPVTIVEMGFLSNPNEDRLLNDSSYQDKIVQGIVLGINEYLK